MVTILRLVCIPFVLFFLIREQYVIGVPFFLAVAFTDAIDGSLARVREQITDWGTFYDPVADKLLIASVILLIVVQHVNPWFGFVIIALEALIILGGFLRRIDGKLVSANVFGKTKMLLQVLGVSVLLLAVWFGIDLFIPFSIATLCLAIIFAIISLFTYGF